jgi:hypothetical protein
LVPGNLGTLNQGRRVNKSSAIFNNLKNVFLTYILLIYCLKVDENYIEDAKNRPETKNVSGCIKCCLIYDALKSFRNEKFGVKNGKQRKGKIKRFLNNFRNYGEKVILASLFLIGVGSIAVGS